MHPSPSVSPSTRAAVVAVFGRGALVEQVRAVLVAHGVACERGADPSGGSNVDVVEVCGWSPRRTASAAGITRRSPWRVSVTADPTQRARLRLAWPDESGVLAAAVLELTDEHPGRPVAEVVCEQRVRRALGAASVPLPGVSVRVEGGVVALDGYVDWVELWAHAQSLAAAVHGVTAVVVGSERVDPSGANDPDTTADRTRR